VLPIVPQVGDAVELHRIIQCGMKNFVSHFERLRFEVLIMASVAIMDVLRCDAVWFGVAVTRLLPHCWCGGGKASCAEGIYCACTTKCLCLFEKCPQ
jgi:hypothetical protein